MPPPGVPEQPQRGGDDDDQSSPPALTVKGELDGRARHERDAEVGEEQAEEQQAHRHHVPGSIAPLDRDHGADAAGDRPEEGHLEREQQIVPGGSEEEDGQDRGEGEPFPHPPRDVDEEQAHAEQEQRHRHQLERPARIHSECIDPDLVDQDRGGEQVLDEGVEEGPQAPGAPVEQEVPLVAPEGQPPEPVEEQDP
jgi:hypothetical protein